ncbi:MAG: glycosyltransferase family 2 protein [Bacilli bacterium]|nr:glycosyltransferase family 2 protein [Bacilli bacterium]MBO6195539.1 glycosyltransferase family 2 protein [Bacilli bacterium]
MKKLLVSIIVPIFNCEKYLCKCLDSILNQQYKNIEILLIDDGSTDSSGQICDQYCKRDTRVKVIHKSNGGVSSARNIGIKNSKGKYICFVDSDDFLDKKYIQYMVENIMNTNSYMSVVKSNKISDINSIKEYSGQNKIRILNQDEALNGLVNGKDFLSSCCNKMYNKQNLKNITFQNVAVGEDLYFNYEVIKNNIGNIVFSNAKLYNYYIGSTSSIMHNHFNIKNTDILNQYDKLLYETNNLYPKFNKNIKMSYVFISIKLLIKMISSNYFNEEIYDKCKRTIFEYKNIVLKSKYNIFKKIFLIHFILMYKSYTNSYNKNNLFKKICCFLNRRLG